MHVLAPTQKEFDWLLGHHRPWLETYEIAASCKISTDLVLEWIDDSSLDYVIDIKTLGATRPAYRIFRPSFDRLLFIRGSLAKKLPPTNFDEAIKDYLRTKHNIMNSYEVGDHLSCTEKHVQNLGPDISLDLSSNGATRCYPRTTQPKLIEFIKRRKV